MKVEVKHEDDDEWQLLAARPDIPWKDKVDHTMGCGMWVHEVDTFRKPAKFDVTFANVRYCFMLF